MKVIGDILIGFGLLFLVLFIGGNLASLGVPAEHQETLKELGYGHYNIYGITNVLAYILYTVGWIFIVVGLLMSKRKNILVLGVVAGIISIGLAYLQWNIFLPTILAN